MVKDHGSCDTYFEFHSGLVQRQGWNGSDVYYSICSFFNYRKTAFGQGKRKGCAMKWLKNILKRIRWRRIDKGIKKSFKEVAYDSTDFTNKK